MRLTVFGERPGGIGLGLDITLGVDEPTMRSLVLRADGLWSATMDVEVAPEIKLCAYDTEGACRAIRVARVGPPAKDAPLVRDWRVTVDGREVDPTHFRLYIECGRPNRFTLREGESPLELQDSADWHEVTP